MSSINQKMAKGVAWMVLARIMVRFLSVISTIILARLLIPEDFGIVAMATSLIALLELATAFSFDIPLIQNNKAGRAEFDTAWTLNILLFGLLALAVFALAGPVASFYQEPRLVDVVHVLAIGFFVRGFENIGIVYFRKQLDFKRDFLFTIAQKVVGFSVTIPLAFLLRNYWALIIGMTVGKFSGIALSYMFHSYRPRFSLAAVSDLMGFSKWLLLNNMLHFLRMRSPDFVIGRIVGSSGLGLFTVAYEISTLPTSELVAPINRAVFPGFSQLKDDTPLLRKSFIQVLGLIALIGLPTGFGIAAVSELVVSIALGSNWSAAAPIIAVLAISGGVGALAGSNGSVCNAIGKPYLITIMGSLHAALLLGLSIVMVLKQGVLGVAYAFLWTNLIANPLFFYVVGREIDCRMREMLLVMWRPILGCLAMYAVVRHFAVDSEQVSGITELGSLIWLVLLGAVTYVLTVAFLWVISGRPQSVEVSSIEWVRSKLGRARASPLADS